LTFPSNDKFSGSPIQIGGLKAKGAWFTQAARHADMEAGSCAEMPVRTPRYSPRVHMIQADESEIDPYLRVHPDERR
jgi:hypothetical protein